MKKCIVTRTFTDMVSGAMKSERKGFDDVIDACMYADDLHDRLLADVEVTRDMYLPEGDGYLTEFFPKMQCVIELSEVG